MRTKTVQKEKRNSGNLWIMKALVTFFFFFKYIKYVSTKNDQMIFFSIQEDLSSKSNSKDNKENCRISVLQALLGKIYIYLEGFRELLHRVILKIPLGPKALLQLCL